MCQLKRQGLNSGSCSLRSGDRRDLACQATLREDQNGVSRFISAVHLSRPENYLSIYQSGCNMACRKCHSWYFTKVKEGRWYSSEDILKAAKDYEEIVTLFEPRERATAWHAQDSCRCCGACITSGRASEYCPGQLSPDQMLISPQGFGPARNIVAFTGGDLTCRPEFYAQCTNLIKSHTKLWVLIETNGYGLTDHSLDHLQNSGVDSFWLDIKAWEDETHRWLTGCSNETILRLPAEILRRGFVLEVLSLYIPDVVEADQLEMIARHLANVDPSIPFTILAFFPEYRLDRYRSPTLSEMIAAYEGVKSSGLKNIRLGNQGIFLKTEADRDLFNKHVIDHDR